LKTLFTRSIYFLDRFHWVWLGLAAPLFIFPTPKRSLVLLIVPGTWLLHWIVKRRQLKTTLNAPATALSPLAPTHQFTFPLPVTPFNSALLLVAIMILISTWATYDLTLSLPSIANVLLGIGLFFAVGRVSKSWTGWLGSLGVFIFGIGLGVAGLGLVGINWLTTKISILNPITARLPTLITGLSGNNTGFHPNIVAGTLLWVLPVILTVSGVSLFKIGYSPPGWRSWQLWAGRLLIWGTTLFMAGILILTQSRAGYLGLGVATLVLGLVVLPPRGRGLFLGLSFASVAILAAIVSPDQLNQVKDWLIGSGITTEGALSLTTLEGRLELWSRALYGLQDFPFTGMGMNTFREVVHVLYPLFLVAPDVDIGHPHNEFLHFGLDLGIPGLIALGSLYLVAFKMLAQIWRSDLGFGHSVVGSGAQVSGSYLKAIVLGLGGGLFAHFVYGFLDGVILSAKPGFVFWILLGLIAGLNQLTFYDSSPGPTENRAAQ
jgi:putative inorganic carbon (hco3(-)) transporter